MYNNAIAILIIRTSVAACHTAFCIHAFEPALLAGFLPVRISTRMKLEDKKMGVISELIRTEEDGTISFGDYTLASKTKKDQFEHGADLYKVKTFREITKLECNGMFVYESVPGTAVCGLSTTENEVSFHVEGPSDAKITLGLSDSTEYEVFINEENVGVMKTNLGGKLTLSVELDAEHPSAVRIVKK